MKVSIIIPAYNCDQYIGKCIESALSQTLKNYEVIVVNDGSTDGTEDEILKYRDKIVYIKQDNKGVSAARNAAILKSNAEYVSFLDADDMYEPSNIETMSSYLDNHPECGLVYCLYERIDQFGDELPKKKCTSYEGDVFQKIFMKCHIYPTCIMCRREHVIDAGLFSEKYSGMAEDCDLYLRMSQKTSFGVVRECLSYYRVHNYGLSRSNNPEFPFKTEEQLLEYKDYLIRNYTFGWLTYRRRFSKIYRDQAHIFLEHKQYSKAILKALQSLRFYPFRLDIFKIITPAIKEGFLISKIFPTH